MAVVGGRGIHRRGAETLSCFGAGGCSACPRFARRGGGGTASLSRCGVFGRLQCLAHRRDAETLSVHGVGGRSACPGFARRGSGGTASLSGCAARLGDCVAARRVAAMAVVGGRGMFGCSACPGFAQRSGGTASLSGCAARRAARVSASVQRNARAKARATRNSYTSMAARGFTGGDARAVPVSF